MKIQIPLLFAGCLALVLCLGCGSSKVVEPQTQADEPGNAPAPVTLVYAEGWTDIAMVANWAKTGVDHLGHFVTSRNACGKDESGAIALDLWNVLAKAVNEIVGAEAGSEEICLPLPQDQRRYMDGTAEVVLSNGTKIPLLDSTRGTGACSKIKNRATAEALFNALNEVVLIADKEGCSVLPY